MGRYLAAGGAVILLLATGLFLVREMRATALPVPSPPLMVSPADPSASAGPAPSADQRSKEARRFDRYDRDNNGQIGAPEYLANRRKAYVKLDRNGDGALSFAEYAIKTQEKFTMADRDRSGALDRGEFAATRPVRRPKPVQPCRPEPQAATEGEAGA